MGLSRTVSEINGDFRQKNPKLAMRMRAPRDRYVLHIWNPTPIVSY